MLLFLLGLVPRVCSENLPYVLTVCDTAVAGPDSYCPDGLTLTIAASSAVTSTLAQIAPSQYQANWRRTGGVIDGGPAVALLREEVIPALGENSVRWLEGFVVGDSPRNWQPPIPLDFVSEIAISEKQFTLPAFSYPLSERKLSTFPYPVWQIFHAPWKRSIMLEDSLESNFILQGMIVRLREIDPGLRRDRSTSTKDQIYGIRLEGVTSKGLKTWTLLKDKPESDVVGLKMDRAVRMTGLTFTLDTSIWFGHPFEPPTDTNCELALDQLLPSSLFIDLDEARHNAGFVDAQYVTPQYHDIELPAHLATPAVYRTRFRLESGKNLYNDYNLTLHDRYIIKYRGEDLSQVNPLIEIQPPSATIVCAHTRSKKLLFTKAVYNSVESVPASFANPYAVSVRGMALNASYEPYYALITSIVVLVVLAWLSYYLIPILNQISLRHEKR